MQLLPLGLLVQAVTEEVTELMTEVGAEEQPSAEQLGEPDQAP